MAILKTNFQGLPWPTSSQCCRRRNFWALARTLLVVAVGYSGCAGYGFAQQPLPSETQLKAAFLINFPKYTEWPAVSFPESNSPVVIAVISETRLADEIQRVLTGRTANGRQIVLKRLASGEDPGACHILFISAAEQKRSPTLLSRLKASTILTVGESDDFLENGGIIKLAKLDQKVALEVDLNAARNSGISISSKLLSVAAVVRGKTR